VNTSYPHSSHHFDWVIPGAKLVIECHGRQHYDVVAWDGQVDGSIEKFKALKARDEQKKQAAVQMGWAYVEIPYNYKGDLGDIIWETWQDYSATQEVPCEPKADYTTLYKEKKREENKKRRREYLASPAHKVQLEKQREYRKKQYRKAKERKAKDE
jgi:hypothetical protein